MFCLRQQMANSRQLAVKLHGKQNALMAVQVRSSGHGHDHPPERWPPLTASQYKEMAQGREYVGYFLFGEPVYCDRPDNPYPAIRFRKDDAEILKLKEKEKADWKKMTLEEKKQLYRASFANTLVECLAPSGHWKASLAVVCYAISLSMVLMCCFKKLCTSRENLPKSLSNEHKEKKLQSWINSFSEPIDGVASKWDYEKNQWKA